MTTEEIIDLIKKNKFGEAEAALYELRKADRHSTMVSYLFGCLTAAYGNPKRSTTQAREFFTHAVNGSPPIEQAFVELSILEDHTSHSLRIVSKGLTLFPDSRTLYELALRFRPPHEKETLFLWAKAKGMVSDENRAEMASNYVELRQFDKALTFL